MDSRRSQHHYGPPPIHAQQHQPQHHPPPQPPPPPPPPQYSQPPPGPHYQQHQHPPPPPPLPPQSAPPYPYQQPPPHPQAQGPPPQSQPSYPTPTYPGATHLPTQGQTLPPIQSTAHPPPATSSEQPNLPSFRHPSAPPPHEQREVGPEYHPQSQYPHNRSGHATPAPVNRTYSIDSGQQRSPATPAGPGPGHFPPSVGQDGSAPPPGHPPPPHHQMEHGGHHGYPPVNGVPHGHPPPHHHHEGHHAMVDQHGYSHYPPPGQSMYPAPSYGPATGNMYGTKRKQMRATQACEQCRQRKQKCDEGTPCSFCKENSLTCQYRDTPPAKTDKNMEKLLSYMENQSAQLLELTQKIDGFHARLRHVEQNSQQSNHTVGGAKHETEPEPVSQREEDTLVLPQQNRKSELEDHRTAPHKLLLLWPSVRPLLEMAGVTLNDGYVVEAEDRGVLRLWTRGEGIDEYDGTQPGGPASPARSDESGEGGSVATPHAEGLWGTGFPTPGSDSRRSEPYGTGAGGLKPNGEVDLDANTINTLYDSYMRHLHILHPFLDKRRLRRMIDNFIQAYSTGRPRATFAVSSHYDSDQRPLKRQRSNGSSANIGSDTEPRKVPTERSPGSAIIYLVLALGKICLHKEPLPAIVPDSKLANVNANISRDIAASRASAADSPINMKPSPTSPHSKPSTHPTPPSEAALRMQDSRSRRSSVEGSSPGSTAGLRNLDVIPGIAYYAKAAEILGDQGDGNDLVHAQMFLLAGLYKGQLARVKESMSWITMAGRAVQSLLDRYKLYNQNYWESYGDVRLRLTNASAQIKDTRQSLIVLASWTCLQLESDILAELKLPSSNIQSIENLLILPNKVPDEESYDALDTDGPLEDYDNILMFYTAQLYIRRRLNQVHNEMYGRESLGTSIAEVQSMLQGHEAVLNAWRDNLPPRLRWDDDDPPPRDILAARLRAKYWGAKYITNRPFLDFALHIMPSLESGKSVEEAAADGYGNRRDKADIHLFKAIEQMGEGEVWKAVKRCVAAAIQSTVAFDGVPDRLIITNIHGTAHAQFGNMLVLCATHQSSYIGSRLVPTKKLQELLERTITFLRRLAPISPTCLLDCGILEKFNHTIFPPATQHPGVYKNEKVAPMSASNSFHVDS